VLYPLVSRHPMFTVSRSVGAQIVRAFGNTLKGRFSVLAPTHNHDEMWSNQDGWPSITPRRLIDVWFPSRSRSYSPSVTLKNRSLERSKRFVLQEAEQSCVNFTNYKPPPKMPE
jgi:hypothetical protein